MTRPKVSVIVPIYNVEKYLNKCIDSLLNQTLKNIEIIMVDDGSPDNCPAMCDEYAKKDPRIKVIHKKNGGLGYARNSGLEVATGEYVAFVDSDDVIDTNTYAFLTKIADQKKLDVIRFESVKFSDDEEIIPIDCAKEDITIYSSMEDIKLLSLSLFSYNIGNVDVSKRIHGSSWGFIYNRKIIEKNKLSFCSEREYISEDYLFSFDYLKYVSNIGVVPHTFYFYRLNPSSLTTTVKLNNIDRCIQYSEFITKKFIKDGCGKDSELYAMGYFISRLIGNVDAVLSTKLYSYQDKKEWLNKLSDSQYFNYIYTKYPKYDLKLQHLIYLYAVNLKSLLILSILGCVKKKMKN